MEGSSAAFLPVLDGVPSNNVDWSFELLDDCSEVKSLGKVPSFCTQASEEDLTWMSSGIMQFSKRVNDISLSPASSSARENQPYLMNKNLRQQLAIIWLATDGLEHYYFI